LRTSLLIQGIEQPHSKNYHWEKGFFTNEIKYLSSNTFLLRLSSAYKKSESKMSFAHAHSLVPAGERPRAQKIEFCLPNLKLKKMSIFT